MSVATVVFALAFVFMIGWHFYRQRKSKESLLAIEEKLKALVDQETSGKLLVATDEKELQLVLAQINRLLTLNQQQVAHYHKAKLEQRKMLANISHDLKTPLTVMIAYIEKLELDREMPEQERMRIIGRLHEKTEQVISQMNKFFALAKLEAGDELLPLRRMELNEVCRQSVLDHYEWLASTGMDVQIDIPEKPIYIQGNEEGLERVLSNLIANAIRYGYEGNVFGLSVTEEEGQAVVDVWDKGKGIPETEQERIFERMYTLDDARNPAFHGSGLGLSITKRLVVAMKGTITAISTPYQKTIFRCTFKKIR
ncbi:MULTISPECIES: sensor histidine kinase [Shouchella]|uniref:histidine kinase n=1 Tax=Shouchella rhizosphaerae TaxID=866786 RepID=A0ABZ2CRE2_9BACI|nr:sensor histidine kinase [Shouchella clausii]